MPSSATVAARDAARLSGAIGGASFLPRRRGRQPSPQLGQQMRWVPRAELATLEFPEADADLIKILLAG